MSLPKIGIITPTIGSGHLEQALESVARQTYSNFAHYIVPDGAQYKEDVISRALKVNPRAEFITIPENTGGNGYYGHRIYGAVPFLLNVDYVCFLDEDNWYELDHLASLMALVQANHFHWAYALRNIYSEDGSFVCQDNCDSLGLWGQWYGSQHHIDTNCLLLNRHLAVKYAPLWHGKGYSPEECNPDRKLARQLIHENIRGFTSSQYTLNYRLGSSRNSAPAEFFLRGNQVMEQTYRAFPWQVCRPHSVNPTIDFRRHLCVDEGGK